MKVKAMLNNMRKPKNLTRILAGSIATIFLLVALKAYLTSSTNLLPEKKIKPAPTTVNVIPVPNQPVLKIISGGKLNVQSPGNIQIEREFGHSRKSKFREKQLRMILEFRKKTHLNVELPQGFTYLDFELDEQVVALSGKSFNRDQNVAVLASTLTGSTLDVLKYVASNSDSFPYMKGYALILSQSQTIAAPSSSNLNDLTIVPSNEKNGRRLFTAITERKDGKGTYVFMMEAPRRIFYDNEEGLEKMLQSLSAQP
jgi:hypothetical protein